MASPSFLKMAIVTASTKRPPVIAGGKRGSGELHVVGMKCTPLDPVNAEIIARNGLADSPVSYLQCETDGDHDVKTGDIFVVENLEYPIRAIEKWDWRGSRYMRFVVEKLKP